MDAFDPHNALAVIGADDETRQAIIAALLTFERRHQKRNGISIRDTVTGPVVDALHTPTNIYNKTLENGLIFSFKYTSRILREFVMAGQKPSHVWEPQTTRTLLHISRGAENVIVGGAYIGDHAIPIAQQIHGSGICHCFELSPESARLLDLNAAQNGLDNVRLNRLGLWSKDGVRLSLGGADSMETAIPADDPAVAVASTISIDTYVRDAELGRVDLVMLDIEGAELEALTGASSLLARSTGTAPAIVFEIHRAYVDWSDGLASIPIVRLLHAAGYTCFAIRDYHGNVDMRGQPIELVDISDIYLEGQPHGFNMRAVKDTTVVDGEPFRIRRGVSPKLLLHRDARLHAPLT